MITVMDCPLYIRPIHQHSLTQSSGMMAYMKCLLFAALAALPFSPAAHAEVAGLKTVYLLPMSGGLDQYLAVQLTTEGVLQVVTDPKKADAILTEGIGGRFDESFSELFKPPVDKDQADKAGATEFSHPAMRPLSGSRGLIFLVNRATRDVVWSTFERPKGNQPEDMKHAAEKIVDRMAKAQKAK